MKASRKRSLGIAVVVVLLPVLAFGIWFRRQIRQQQLDHALIAAMKKRDVSTAIALLDQGADANTLDKPIRAITFNSIWADFVNRLMRKEPVIDAEDCRPALLLLYGPVYFGEPDTSIELVMNVKAEASEGFSSENKVASAPLLAALLKHGANLHGDNHAGETLLGYACICDDVKTVKTLLEQHVDANTKYPTGCPALMCTEDYECARLLLEAGADVNARDESGRTWLMFIHNMKLYPLLWKYKANVNARDEEGKTALIHLFTSHYQDDTHIYKEMRLLLQHGAKIAIKDKAGKTVLDYARGGKVNWMVGGSEGGRYDPESMRLLEAALKKEQAQISR